jgi:dTMP kinase
MGPLRGAAGLSQQALAERVKIDVTYLSKLENGRQHASDRVLRSLAEAPGVEPVRLLVMACRIPSELQGTVQEALLGEATSTQLLSRPEGAPAGGPAVIAKRTRPGLLVTLEGPGGGGKSTVTALLAGRLAVAGLPVMATTEPSRTELGSFVRRSTDEYGGLTLAYLVAADRHHHLETEVRPALGAGRVVICDRYVASSLVLQGMDGVEEQTIWDLARHAELPDLAVVLSASPDVLAARVAARGPHSRGSATRATARSRLPCTWQLRQGSGPGVWRSSAWIPPPRRRRPSRTKSPSWYAVGSTAAPSYGRFASCWRANRPSPPPSSRTSWVAT